MLIMAYFPGDAAVALGLIGGGGVVACGHILAARIRHECALHDLRVRAAELRAAYAKRLEEAEMLGEVETVEDEPAVAGRVAPADTPAATAAQAA